MTAVRSRLAFSGAALLLLLTPAISRASITISPNPLAGAPVSATTTGTAPASPTTVSISYGPGPDCTGAQTRPIATHDGIPAGPYQFTDSFTPSAPGSYCLYVTETGGNSTSSQGQSFVVGGSAGQTGGSAGGQGSTGGAGTPQPPGGGNPQPRPVSTVSAPVRSAGPLALSAALRQRGGGAPTTMVLAIHLRAPSSVAVELLLSSATARRLNIRAAADRITHGRYVVLVRKRVGRLPAGRVHIGLRIARSTAVKLARGGRLVLVARATLTGVSRRVNVLTARRAIGR